MTYEAPRLTIHGSVEALTMSNSQGNGVGNECKVRGANGLKQTGGVDLNIQAQVQSGLGSCSI
jgi:hypothetical protein